MRVMAFLFFLVIMIAAPPTQAQRPPSASMVCAPTNSEPVQLTAIAADPRKWLGHCVTLSGVYADERVYANVDAIYGKTAASIGGYVDGRGSMDGFWRGEFTGRIADCAKAAADLEAGLLHSPGILIDGNRQAGCKSAEGQFLQFMSQGLLVPADIVRVTSPTTGRMAQAFAPVLGDWPHYPGLEKAVVAFLTAFRAGDRRALAARVGGDYAAERVLSEDSALTSLRSPTALRSVAFADHFADSAAAFDATTCFCRSGNCAKLWPIAQRDADNQSSRPYACLRVVGHKQAEAWSYEIDALARFDGLPEPKH